MRKLGMFQKILVLIAVVVTFSVILTSSIQENSPQNATSNYEGPPRAAIIDQLHDEIPNVYFQNQAIEYLETAGYQVDLFTTEQLTVDFYKKIPTMNYEYIVFRTHAIGNDGQDSTEKLKVSLFTGEKYRDDKYITEQLSGQIGKGAPYMNTIIEASVNLSEMDNSNQTRVEVITPFESIDNSNPYFVIGPKYVDEVMEGKFPNSVLVLGGCSTLSNPSLANSLINRGASSVVGWDNLVGSANNDSMILAFLENHLINNMEIQDAVEIVKENTPKNTRHGANFSYQGIA